MISATRSENDQKPSIDKKQNMFYNDKKCYRTGLVTSVVLAVSYLLSHYRTGSVIFGGDRDRFSDCLSNSLL